MKNSGQILMTEGSPWKSILRFALPLLVGNIFQQMYHTADTMMVGRFVNEQALSSVGTCGVLINLLIAFSSGFSIGTGVISAQMFGAGREEEISKNAYVSMTLFICMGVVTGVFSVLAGEYLLKYLVCVPESLLMDAAVYFKICASGFVFVFLYNAIAALLRSVGDSKASLYFLIISSAVNVILDWILMAVCEMGVTGAALATVISQITACVGSFIYMKKRYEVFRFKGKSLSVSMSDIWILIKTGTPMALQSMVGTIFNLFMQRLVNSFGPAMTASYTVVGRYEGYMHLPTTAMDSAMATFAAQNKGAGRFDRIETGLKHSLIIACAVTSILSTVSFVYAPQITEAFGIDGTAAVYCTKHIRILAFPFLLFAGYFPCTGMYQGVGKGHVATAISTVFLVICLFFGYTLQYIPGIEELSLMICKPIAWLCIAPVNYVYYFRGNWKNTFKKGI